MLIVLNREKSFLRVPVPHLDQSIINEKMSQVSRIKQIILLIIIFFRVGCFVECIISSRSVLLTSRAREKVF